MFVEEFGLKRMTAARNTLIEIDRASFEAGRWASFVNAAYEEHQERKSKGQMWSLPSDSNPGKVIVGHLEEWLAGAASSA